MTHIAQLGDARRGLLLAGGLLLGLLLALATAGASWEADPQATASPQSRWATSTP